MNRYFPSLDGLRALAVIFVIIYHWFPNSLMRVIPLGSIGVDIFFVLSGFLITRILLVERESDQYGGYKILKFYFRRALRIFPLYYGVLLGLIFFSFFLPSPILEYFPYFFFHLQNFLFLKTDSFLWGKVGHFWSLAVEEQFYLFWPWFIMFLPYRYLLPFLLIVVSVGLFSSIYFSLVLFPDKHLIWAHTLTCIHAFGLGGILSFSLNQNYTNSNLRAFLFISIPVLLVLYFWIKIYCPIFLALDRFIISLVTCGLIFVLVTNNGGQLGTFFGNRFLVKVGQISYGIYVFHNFIPTVIRGLSLSVYKKTGLDLRVDQDSAIDSIIFFSICFCVLYIVSVISYSFFESRFLILKGRIS